MHSKLTTELIAKSIAGRMTEITARLETVFRNLDDNQPGYPSQTPMASPASGPSGEPDGLLAVERFASRPDPAQRDLRAVHEIVERLRTPVDELYSIVAKWGYVRNVPDVVADDQTDWCVSHLRIQSFEPTYRIVQGAPLCHFCWYQQTSYHCRPSLDLLDRHSRGRVSTKERAADAARQVKPARRRKRAA